MRYRTVTVDFEIILPCWKDKLWPGRKDAIRPMSDIVYLGGHDPEIYKKFKPTFFVVYNTVDEIIGVNSGHRTTDNLYRSRGLWVDPRYRRKGISGILFCELYGQAMKENCKGIWSIPRKESLAAYEKYGFVKTSDFFDKGMEFGPNCYVYKEIDYELKQH
jgi:GNAT superfamily N-acetyltransferase